MNAAQRQILADRIDFLSRETVRVEEDIAQEQARIDRRKIRLAAAKAELAALQEGVDW